MGRMASPYRQIFAVPGTATFELAAAAARMAHLMTVLSIIFFIQAVTGSYGLAGVASAAYALTYSLASPFVSRLADRVHPGRVLAAATAAGGLCRAGLLAAVWAGAPVWVTVGLAACSGGSMPAIGPMARARWSQLLHGSPLLHAALSFESVVDEAIMVAAPILVAVLATSVSPAAGLIMTLALATGGTAALAAQRRGGSATARPGGSPRGAVISAPGFPALILAFVLVGAALTMIDLSTVAFSTQHHGRALSGLILATIALASGASGLRYGSRPLRTAPQRRLPVALALLTCGTLLFAVAPGVWFLFAAAGLLGLTVSPAFITGFSAVGLAVPEGRLTEGLTWVTTAMGAGISIGSATAGQIVDACGTRVCFGCAACCTSAAVLAGYTVRRRLRAPVS
jgi:hypothetical protein